jgi:hypothetical protein
VGVAPCDLYLALYWRCVRRKFPESAEQEFEASFIQACERWRAATRSARGRDDLAQGCVEALRRSSVDHPNCCWKRECASGGKRWHTTD